MPGSKKGNVASSYFRNKRIQMVWKDVKEAISGTERDFTKAKLGHAIFILAVPMVLEMVMESVFAVVDIYFVSRLGADAVATVGITESVMTIVYAISSGLAMATTALVARRIGEKRKKKAGEVAFQAILIGVFVSLLLGVPGVIFAKEFLVLMGGTETMAEKGALYPAIMFGSSSVVMLLFIINAVFRSAGDAAISMRVVWVANLINLILDPLLIFGIGPFPELGLAGAAIATGIGRGLAVAYQFYLLFRGNFRIKLYWQNIKLKLEVMKELLRISGGGILQNLIATSSWIFLVRIIAVGGPEVLAGYTIALRIILFSLLPAWGVSNAAATLVGQNLGAKHPERAEKAVWITGYINIAFMSIIGIILVLFPEFFIRFFIQEPEVLTNGVLSLRIISFGFLFYALGMVLIQGFNGSGDTFTPTKINLLCFWIVEIPLAYFLAIFLGKGLVGACIAIVLSETLLTVLALFLFKKGTWKKREV
ncbi:putative efflux protein, MATE family [Mariniphaga anaerophila]|uniref:Multidrug-efflux transporter n=1 Tax=Mariniphaga anaerophila TaxID=1484053 RepID=A0A1M5AJN2_9BACT|nr:MATE family efflux transporter [Mariniphaga anaerophila]SHF30481.1 putative efflux protein, MATE family [Mariniphaga anaerophila]